MSFNIDSSDLFKKIGMPEEIGEVKKTEAEETEGSEIIDMVPQTEEGEETTDNEKLNKAEYEFEIAAENYLNNMLNEASVINALDGIVDGVKDGKISEEEKQAFLKEIVGDDNYITYDEINAGLKAHGYGVSDKNSEDSETEEAKEKEEDYTLKDLAKDMSTAIGGAAQMGAMATQAAAQQMSNSMADGFSSVNDALSDIADSLSGKSKLNAKDLEGMSLEELKEEQDNREDQLKTANSELQQAESNYQTALQREQEITDELKQRQQDNQDAIDAKQGEIKETQDEIVSTESKIKDKESLIADLEAQANAPLPPETITVTNPDGSTSEVTNPEYAPAKAAQDAAKEQLEKEKQELEKLQGELDTLENETLPGQEEELEALEVERTRIETEIMNSNCSEETKLALKNFNEADRNQYAAQNNVYEVNREIAKQE